jgi:hypothetical protein
LQSELLETLLIELRVRWPSVVAEAFLTHFPSLSRAHRITSVSQDIDETEPEAAGAVASAAASFAAVTSLVLPDEHGAPLRVFDITLRLVRYAMETAAARLLQTGIRDTLALFQRVLVTNIFCLVVEKGVVGSRSLRQDDPLLMLSVDIVSMEAEGGTRSQIVLRPGLGTVVAAAHDFFDSMIETVKGIPRYEAAPNV